MSIFLIVSALALLAILSSGAATAKPFDYTPHFKTVWIKGNAFSNAEVTVMMHGFLDDPRRARKELVSSEITIEGEFLAEMSKGYITGIDIGHTMVAGDYGLNVFDARPDVGEEPPGGPSPPEPREHGSFSFDVSTNDFPPGIRAGILDTCNTAGTATYGFPVAMQVKARRWKRGDNNNRRRDRTVHGKMPIKVICLPTAENKAPPEPFLVDVRVEQKGETCPKQTDVTAIIKYKVPAIARFRFKVDGKLSKVHEIKARKVSGGGKPAPGGLPHGIYLVERLKTYHLDPGQTHFRIVMEDGSGKKSAVKTVKIKCPPFEVTSAWLKYKVEKKLTCPKKVVETATFKATRPGKAPFEIKHQGGLVVHSGKATFKRKGMEYVAKVKRNLSMNAFDGDMMADITNGPANSGWVRLQVPCMEVLSGTLDLRGFEATRCEGEAAFSIRTNMPGKVPYQLDCTGGRSWKGKVEAHQTGPNTYIGVGVKRFDVSNNEQVNCALKTAKPLPYKVLALKGRKYECHRTTGVSGTNDLAPETRPEDPVYPGEGETLTGDFSFIDHGSPKCERTGKALATFRSPKADNIHYSLDCKFFSKSGVLATQPHPAGGYMAAKLISFGIDKTVDETCTLRTVAPYGPKDHVTKSRLFQCVTPTLPPATTDLTPETRPDSSGSRYPGKVIVVPPRVVIDPPREPKRPDRVVVDPPRTPSDSVPPSYPVPPGGKSGAAADVKVIDTGKGGKDSSAADATPDYPKKTRGDAEADKKRLEALKRKQALEARKKAEVAKKAAEARRKREAAKKAAEARRKREAAKKAAELRRKHTAAKKAAELRHRREAAKRAAAAKKAAEARRKHKVAPTRSNRSRIQRRR